MIYDIITYNGEEEMFEIRYNILKNYVDQFIVVEAPTTFKGDPKPIYFNKEYDKVRLIICEFGKNWELLKHTIKSQITEGKEAFCRAYYQKDWARHVVDIKDDDIVYFGDIDEIWTPQEVDDRAYKLEQIIYSGYLNQRTNEPWTGTVVTRGKNLCVGLNELRHYIKLTKPNGGWHFTFQGGAQEIKRKLESYDHQEFNTNEIKNNIESNLQQGTDFLNRQGITQWIDELNWPEYLKNNRDKYKHSLRP